MDCLVGYTSLKIQWLSIYFRVFFPTISKNGMVLLPKTTAVYLELKHFFFICSNKEIHSVSTILIFVYAVKVNKAWDTMKICSVQATFCPQHNREKQIQFFFALLIRGQNVCFSVQFLSHRKIKSNNGCCIKNVKSN